jgi:hypothetical protein
MADALTPTSVLYRLERLERDNRRYKLAAGALAVLIFSWTACSTAGQEKTTVAAERLVLVGPDGSERAALELDQDGNPLLHMRHEDSLVALTTRGPSLLLRSPDGKTRAFMGIDSRNTSTVELATARMIDGLRMSVHQNGSTGLQLLDGNGRRRGTFEGLSEGAASVSFLDETGKTRGQLGLDPAGIPNLILMDGDGTRRMGMLVQQDGSPSLELADDLGRTRARVTTLFDGSPLMEMSREDGTPSYVAP